MIERDLYILANLTTIIDALLHTETEVIKNRKIPQGFKELKKELKNLWKDG